MFEGAYSNHMNPFKQSFIQLFVEEARKIQRVREI